MPESSFSTANQISPSEYDPDKFVKQQLLAKFANRDVELMDLLNPFGGPTSTGAGSAIAHDGNVTLAANQTLGGLHFYDSLAINQGVTITTDGPLILVARSFIDATGAIINADGMGSAPIDGYGSHGVSGAGGASWTSGVVYGMNGGNSMCSIGGVATANNAYVNATAIDAAMLGAVLANSGIYGMPQSASGLVNATGTLGVSYGRNNGRFGGASGGGGGSNKGGNGGGCVIMVSPRLILTNATISANGLNGISDGSSGGGGGGGGFFYAKTKSYLPPSSFSVAGGSGSNNGGNGADGFVQIDIFG